MKKQIMSIAAAAALFTTGAMAFDMNATTGGIIDDITAGSNAKMAIYTAGVEANASLSLSSNRQGNALIYPAYRSGNGWETEIFVRNTKNVAILAKAVVYAKDNSRELGDFNLYLSPHDAVRFTIKDNKVTSTDGSIARQVKDPLGTVTADDAKFATEAEPFEMDLQANTDEAGYVIVYAMAEQKATGNSTADAQVYHGKHNELFQDYRKMLDICRESVDANGSTPANWRKVFTKSTTTAVSNGTAVDGNLLIKAPNLDENCTTANSAAFVGNWALDANFTSPSTDALFGEVEISHGGDKRSLLLSATALSNYVTGNQIMLWTEGEYAAIQDRRILPDVDSNVSTPTTYNTNGIKADALTFVVNNAYFTFNKNATEGKNDYAFLVTQPMKRALVMAEGTVSTYWTGTNPLLDTWGNFTINKTPWTEDEGTIGTADIGYITLNSPLEGSTVAITQYSNELATFTYDDMVNEIEDSLDEYGFKNGETAGYIDLTINPNKGLPAIITQMSSRDIENEAQINWINSATN